MADLAASTSGFDLLLLPVEAFSGGFGFVIRSTISAKRLATTPKLKPMRVDVVSSPSYAMAYLTTEPGEEITVERGGLVAMSSGISVAAGVGEGGLVKAGLRRAMGGESFFVGQYTSHMSGAWLAVAPSFPGDIGILEVGPNSPWTITTGAFLAGEKTVSPDLAYGGFKLAMLHEGLTALRLNGRGTALVAAYGGLEKMIVREGQEIVIDTGHLVAWTTGMSLRLGTLGGVVTTNVIGEGLVGVFSGPGEIYVQTRAEGPLRNWLFPDVKGRGNR